MSKLFVYGTLKKGYSAHYLLERWSPTFLGKAQTQPNYGLYDQGPFPGMVQEAAGGGVHGEVYEVTEKCLEAMDQYEAVDHGLFRRAEVELTDGSKAIAYLICKPSRNAYKVQSGVWGLDGEEESETD